MGEELTFVDQETAGIIAAINRFSPQTKEGRIVSTSKHFWREPAYFHERVVVSAWVCLTERTAKGGISRLDVEDFIKIVEWLHFLKKEQVEAEKPRKRETPPPLFSFNRRVEIEGILANAADKAKFFDRPDWQRIVIASARKLTAALDSIFTVSLFEEEKVISSEAAKTSR